MANVPTQYRSESSLRKACERGQGLAFKSISLTFKPSQMTDSSTTGTISFPADALPASCFVFGWKCVASVAWNLDTSAIIKVGIVGTTALYSSVTSGSIFAAGTVGSDAASTTGYLWQAAAATPIVTVTTGADFTTLVTADTARATVTIYYLPAP